MRRYIIPSSSCAGMCDSHKSQEDVQCCGCFRVSLWSIISKAEQHLFIVIVISIRTCTEGCTCSCINEMRQVWYPLPPGLSPQGRSLLNLFDVVRRHGHGHVVLHECLLFVLLRSHGVQEILIVKYTRGTWASASGCTSGLWHAHAHVRVHVVSCRYHVIM